MIAGIVIAKSLLKGHLASLTTAPRATEVKETMENFHRTLSFSKAEEWPEHFALSDRVTVLADNIFDNLGKRNLQRTDLLLYQVILLFIYYKSSSSFLAVTVLCDKGLVGDAKTCCRKLIEMMINMKYMLDDKDTRADQYFHHLPQVIAKNLRDQERSHNIRNTTVPDLIKATQEDVKRMCEQAKEHWEKDEEGKIIGDFRRNWSGKKLWEMAKASGMENSYISPYLLFCISTHASVDDMANYYDPKLDVFAPVQEHDDIPMVMIEAIRSYWALSVMVADAFDQDLKSSLERIHGKLRELEKLLCSD